MLDFLFGPPTIIGENYLLRWVVLSTRWGGIYLHKIVGDDPSPHMHDHRKRFISIGLRGCYIEETPHGIWRKKERFTAPWMRSFPYTHKHRLLLPGEPCWTLCIISAKRRDSWGFFRGGAKVDHKEYLRPGA